MKTIAAIQALLGAAILLAASAQADTVATFDDLALPPPLTGGTGLQYTNSSNSLDYAGVTWDARFGVVGDQYRVSSSGPLFGIAHSGHYFVTNNDGASGLTISTSKLLTGAWFGRNQYMATPKAVPTRSRLWRCPAIPNCARWCLIYRKATPASRSRCRS